MDDNITLKDIKDFGESIKLQKESIKEIEEVIDYCVSNHDVTGNMEMLTVSKKLYAIKAKMEGKDE